MFTRPGFMPVGCKAWERMGWIDIIQDDGCVRADELPINTAASSSTRLWESISKLWLPRLEDLIWNSITWDTPPPPSSMSRQMTSTSQRTSLGTNGMTAPDCISTLLPRRRSRLQSPFPNMSHPEKKASSNPNMSWWRPFIILFTALSSHDLIWKIRKITGKFQHIHTWGSLRILINKGLIDFEGSFYRNILTMIQSLIFPFSFQWKLYIFISFFPI